MVKMLSEEVKAAVTQGFGISNLDSNQEYDITDERGDIIDKFAVDYVWVIEYGIYYRRKIVLAGIYSQPRYHKQQYPPYLDPRPEIYRVLLLLPSRSEQDRFINLVEPLRLQWPDPIAVSLERLAFVPNPVMFIGYGEDTFIDLTVHTNQAHYWGYYNCVGSPQDKSLKQLDHAIHVTVETIAKTYNHPQINKFLKESEAWRNSPEG
jgi:hypothetical protein